MAKCTLNQSAFNAYTAGQFRVTFPITITDGTYDYLANLPQNEQPSLTIYIEVTADATNNGCAEWDYAGLSASDSQFWSSTQPVPNSYFQFRGEEFRVELRAQTNTNQL